MKFTNSSLVDYKLLSPMNSGQRTHVIDTISIHCVVGQCGVEALGHVFQTKEASSNYGIGYDGRVGLYVEEKNVSWCTSNQYNDNRAVTIEVASDTYAPYKVTSAAYKTLIKLVADICKRNGIKKLVWSTSKNDRVNHLNGCNMTVHRDYSSKSCPGDYLYNLHGQIAKEVNALLGASTDSGAAKTDSTVKIKSDSKLRSVGYCGGNSKVLAALKKGTTVTHLADDGWGWSKISAGGKTGWVQNTRLSKSGLSGYPTMTVTADVLNVRADYSTSAKIVSQVSKGTKLTVRYIVEAGEGKGWAEVAYPNSSGIAYVSAQFLRK